MTGHWLALSLALLLSTTAVRAQEAPPPDLLPEVVVEAPGEGEITAFVAEALPENRARQLPRWHRPICVALRGFSTAQQGRFIERLQSVAAIVGLRSPERECRPNVIVVLTDQPDRFVDLALEQQARLFRPVPTKEVRKALAQQEAVRIWYLTMMNGAQGQTPDSFDMPGGSGPITSVRAAPGGLSRIGMATRTDMFRAMVVLDKNAVANLPLNSLADHVGMRLLSTFANSTEQSALPTILDLFQIGQKRVAGLTEWDRALLRELYTAPVDAHLYRQRRQIARRLTDTAAKQQ